MGSPKAQLWAIDRLEAYGDEAAPAIRTALAEGESNVFIRACKAVELFGEDTKTLLLPDLLIRFSRASSHETNNYETRVAISRAVEWIENDDSGGTKLLLPILEHQNCLARRGAAYGLWNLAQSKRFPIPASLLDCLENSNDVDTQQFLLGVIEHSGSSRNPRISLIVKDKMQSSDPRVRAFSIKAAASLKLIDAVSESLIASFLHDAPEVQYESLRFLKVNPGFAVKFIDVVKTLATDANAPEFVRASASSLLESLDSRGGD